ncbi:MAG TPA: 23S rRNA (pseudouridine(1915)-N(3))-methyltransferase RlmH [bacterium]|nr:23S rRNA (pseudouridine(1915)-N(3))-methyltransferase RlmH [bacterium]
MKIRILTVGKPSDPHYNALCEGYLGRIRHYLPVEHHFIRQVRATGAVAEILAREEAQLLEKIGAQEWCVVLESRGEGMDSLAFAAALERHMVGGRKSLLFIVGGPHGLGDGVLRRANQRLSLSAMTMAHELALTVLLEQLFRALTILRGEGYHK